MDQLLEVSFFLGSLLGGLLLLAWAWQDWRCPRYWSQLEPRPMPYGLVDFVLGFLILAIAPSLFLALFPQVVDGQRLLLQALGEGLALGALAVFLSWRYPQFVGLGHLPSFDRCCRLVSLGLVVALVSIPLILRIQALASAWIEPYSHPTLEALKQPESTAAVWGLVLRAVVLAPIAEEWLYRGLLQGAVERWWTPSHSNPESLLFGLSRHGDSHQTEAQSAPSPTAGLPFWLPILVSSTLFALAHLGLGASPIPLFVLGLVLGYLFARTGSVLSCIVVHLLLNAYSITLILVA